MENNFWIDVHTHLEMLEEGPEEGLKKAKMAGVERVITIGTHPKEYDIILSLMDKYPEVVCATLGVHPHEAQFWSDEIEQFLRINALRPQVVGIGELGLDFYYEHSDRKSQQNCFEAQLNIAQDLGLPVQIHTRDAEKETIETLSRYPNVNGIIHCFSGSQWLAEQSLSLGYDISLSGIVTFKNADELRRIVSLIPIDRIHIETDAPFLAPIPYRGKKNTPAYVIETAKQIATLKNITLEQLRVQLQKNARRRFPKMFQIFQ